MPGKRRRRPDSLIVESDKLFIKYWMNPGLISSVSKSLKLHNSLQYSIEPYTDHQLCLIQNGRRVRFVAEFEQVIPLNSELYVTKQDDEDAQLHCGKKILYTDSNLWCVPLSMSGMPEEIRYWAETLQEQTNFEFTFLFDLWFIVAQYI